MSLAVTLRAQAAPLLQPARTCAQYRCEQPALHRPDFMTNGAVSSSLVVSLRPGLAASIAMPAHQLSQDTGPQAGTDIAAHALPSVASLSSGAYAACSPGALARLSLAAAYCLSFAEWCG